MELNKIEVLLEKYFEGLTDSNEENELRNYFSVSDVAPHLEQYKPLFGYFIEAKKEKIIQNNSLIFKKRKVAWLSIAASVTMMLGVGTYAYFSINKEKQNQELGTYDDPKEALEATQKALAMVSNHVNEGVEGMQYIKVYEVTKDKVFVQ